MSSGNIKINANAKDISGLIEGHYAERPQLDDPSLIALPVVLDEHGEPCVNTDISVGGGKAAYDFVHKKAAPGMKMHVIPGVWYFCVIDAELTDPMLIRDGDSYVVAGNRADNSQTVCTHVTRENLLCLLNRDKQGRCGCSK